ncbi:hypothetical protein AAVH_41794, partial [Aphelenchoides avenae]
MQLPHFQYFEFEAYADELEDIFRLTDRHEIPSLCVTYKRSLVTPGCDFLSKLFTEARKRSLSELIVSLDTELQVGFQLLSEIFQDWERPSAENVVVIVPRLKGFRLLRRVAQ